ncbi:ribosome recycling factor [Helicobacter sp. 13S00401-1]|uniref:ribosome recycling factor n=1 Tax=Helicobacter sp. 13S00401-1 TaxID=1905758 RepID=UPI000BA62718|nr:ribosome recycling factor [Helicobacter sp. 13S00401-1]PAF51879.1 ribosome recycling factor [Helicobacter sp. 13S00401-1]
MLENIYKDTKDSMQKSLGALSKDFSTLRSGRVSISVLDNVRVNYYDSLVPLSNVANINLTDATTIVISPWEKNVIKDIEKAILEANIGVNPNADADGIKLFFPPMTSEQRVQVAKQARAMCEKAKVAIRNIRQNSNNQIKKLEKDKAITADDAKRGEAEVQKITDEFIKKADTSLKSKEEEVMKV